MNSDPRCFQHWGTGIYLWFPGDKIEWYIETWLQFRFARRVFHINSPVICGRSIATSHQPSTYQLSLSPLTSPSGLPKVAISGLLLSLTTVHQEQIHKEVGDVLLPQPCDLFWTLHRKVHGVQGKLWSIV